MSRSLVAIAWILFLAWSVFVALVWTFGIGEAQVLEWSSRFLHLALPAAGEPPAALPAAFLKVLAWADPLLAILAAAHVYGFTVAREGLGTARRWALLVLLPAFAMMWLSARTNWPIGRVHYTEVPLRALVWVPLLWFAVILGARDLSLRLRPRLLQLPLALLSATFVLFFDIAFEFVAWRERAIWIYDAEFTHARFQLGSYASWFILAAAVTFALREPILPRRELPYHRSPAAIFVILLVLAVLGAVGHIFR